MAKYRKRPVVIEAEQWKNGDWRETSEFIRQAVCQRPDCPTSGEDAIPHIHTLEGPHLISEGDWIIRGIKGEFYPCKPDIFEQTYEPAAQQEGE